MDSIITPLLQRAATPLSSLSKPAWARRLKQALARAWHDAFLSADERWLREAADLEDLEHRLKQLERARNPHLRCWWSGL